jgi:hypothetical protein
MFNNNARESYEIEEVKVGLTKECMDAVGDTNMLDADRAKHTKSMSHYPSVQ